MFTSRSSVPKLDELSDADRARLAWWAYTLVYLHRPTVCWEDSLVAEFPASRVPLDEPQDLPLLMRLLGMVEDPTGGWRMGP